MRQIKCYGRKNTKILENSLIKAFFETSNPQVNSIFPVLDLSRNCDTSSNRNEINFSKSEESSLFCSFKKESPRKSLFSINKNKKCTVSKYKAPLHKIQKYKGKRKCKKVYKKLKCRLAENFPSFGSIIEHNLAVEHEERSPLSSTKRKHVRESLFTLSKNNSQIILETIELANNHSDLYSSEDDKHLSVGHLGKSCIDRHTDLCSKLLTPIRKCQSNLNKITKNNNMILTKDGCELKQTLNNPHAPVTSTPITESKSFGRTKRLHAPNLSVISVSNKYKKHKRLSINESEYISHNANLHKQVGRSLTSSNKEKSLLQIGNRAQQELPRKSFSNVDKSIFIKSHSCLQEVSRENEQESILQMLLELCSQKQTLAFADIYDWSNATVRKVGEGSYGEVFMLTRNKQSIILKVIPVSQDFENNLQSMESVYSEIKVSLVLSKLRYDKDFQTKNFNLLKKVHVVQGQYPNKLLRAWDGYSNAKTTYNYRPDVFAQHQIFVILELEYGGKDMTSFVFRNGAEAESVFKQIVISIAIAEEAHLFEHRDLHLGNILVQRTKSKKICYKFRGKSIFTPSEGVLVTIIDFTLSRVLHEGCVYYNDLADDESLFMQSGDFQFEVYKVTKQKLENQWHECLLYSNVLWLIFLCKKLLEHEYCRPSSAKHKKGLINIKAYASKLDCCKSASDCLEVCKIIDPFPAKLPGQDSRLSNQTLFIDRKSLQKSNFSTFNT